MTATTLRKATTRNALGEFRAIRAYVNGKVVGGATFEAFRGEWVIDFTGHYDSFRVRDDEQGAKAIAILESRWNRSEGVYTY